MENSQWNCWVGRGTPAEAITRLRGFGAEGRPNTSIMVLRMSITAVGLAAMRRQGTIEVTRTREEIHKYRVYGQLYPLEKFARGQILYTLTAL